MQKISRMKRRTARACVAFAAWLWLPVCCGCATTGNVPRPADGNAPPVVFTNSLGMKFAPVPGTPVWFSIWDVRVQDYRAYAAANPGVDASWQQPGFKQGDTHPVVNVNWHDAQAFCAWLSRREGKTYRLPTDAEWSVAAGLENEIGDTPVEKLQYDLLRHFNEYLWGTNGPPPRWAGNYSSAIRRDGYTYTSPVGSFAANRFGLFDLGGNVTQWCEDWYDQTHRWRVARGTSFGDHGAGYGLSLNRANHLPDRRSCFDGFQCVLEPAVNP